MTRIILPLALGAALGISAFLLAPRAMQYADTQLAIAAAPQTYTLLTPPNDMTKGESK